MSKFKGTAGPWEFHEDDGDGNQIVVGDNGDVICVIGSYMTSIEEDFANGPLIAAAPELLSALDLILSYHDDGNCVLHREDVSRARAAIKKALGQ